MQPCASRLQPCAPRLPPPALQVRLMHDLELCVKHKVPIVITSLGARQDVNGARVSELGRAWGVRGTAGVCIGVRGVPQPSAGSTALPRSTALRRSTALQRPSAAPLPFICRPSPTHPPPLSLPSRQTPSTRTEAS